MHVIITIITSTPNHISNKLNIVSVLFADYNIDTYKLELPCARVVKGLALGSQQIAFDHVIISIYVRLTFLLIGPNITCSFGHKRVFWPCCYRHYELEKVYQNAPLADKIKKWQK